MKEFDLKRYEEMEKLRNNGATYAKIGEKYGLSAAGVRSILMTGRWKCYSQVWGKDLSAIHRNAIMRTTVVNGNDTDEEAKAKLIEALESEKGMPNPRNLGKGGLLALENYLGKIIYIDNNRLRIGHEYTFAVSLCGGWVDGNIRVKAKNEEEAYEKGMDYICERLVKAFPEFGIDYNVELIEKEDK